MSSFDESDEIPFWTLSDRVTAWNFLYDFAKKVNQPSLFSTSPFLTSAFSYLSRFYHILYSSQLKPDKDMLTLCITSAFISRKQFDLRMNLDSIITIFLEVFNEYSSQEKKPLSNTKYGKNQVFQFQQLKSDVLSCELFLLTIIGWDFIMEHPFAHFIQYIKLIRHQSDNDMATFRKMRSRAARYVITIMVCEDNFQLEAETIATAAIHRAISDIPQENFSADVESRNFWIKKLEIENDGKSYLKLSKEIAQMEEKLSKFALQAEEKIANEKQKA
ncbi:hypothetical protein TRFO_13518 [Tritrichomonas foetus]|uniref:Cyclin N-terminal domain-containing protein n=1 Tax=Tritrichomonas foetus TaxID=1144522 RepID=A0A1J4L260_9EUKA|nr:hypothetical protein TRFO_13518 [Tritrichomonas foetus]|eukprot:OHT16030.1 hypothetical protein TRFO_13518 [Tritrichomonas foetus]